MNNILIEKILEIINDNIENSEIDITQIDEDLITLGMDSIVFIKIVVALEETFQCEIPDSKLLISKMNTVNKIFMVLDSTEK